MINLRRHLQRKPAPEHQTNTKSSIVWHYDLAVGVAYEIHPLLFIMRRKKGAYNIM